MNWNVLVGASVLLALLQSFCEAGSGCPYPEDVLPCMCKRIKGYTTIVCDGSKEEISISLGVLSRKSIISNAFEIISSDLQIIPARYFGMADTVILVLKTPKLNKIDPSAFRTMERELRVVRVYQSALTGLSSLLPALKDLFYLHELVVNGSPHITTIPANAFNDQLYNPGRLITLDLNNNNISTIGPNAFTALVNLQHLNLDNNKISSFHPTSIVKVNSKIKTLSIVGNSLMDLPVDLIKRLNRGSHINLQNNSIAYISVNDIRVSAERLVKVNLEGNMIICNSNFRVLAFMNFEHHRHYMIGSCYSPPEFRGIPFNKLNVSDFTSSKF